MERTQTTEQEFAHDELTLDEFAGLEVIELPERELMCGCGGSGTGLFIGVAVAANVNLGCTSVSLAAGAAVN